MPSERTMSPPSYIFKKSRQGELDLADFPLLVHVNDVLEQGKDARLPWTSFTFDHSAG